MTGQREALLGRRERVAADVRQFIRQIDYWNRRNPTEEPIPIDDAEHSLRRALRQIGLDLDTLRADVLAGED